MAKAESCHNCVYARWNPGQWMASLSSGFPARPTCGNQPDFPGRMRECPLGRVCRNYRAKPPTPKGETVKTIPLGDGFYAYVDAADYGWLSQWNWHLQGGYAARWKNGRWAFMHREILQPSKGKIVDHKNHNKLDNTRDNLRACTRQENMQNKAKQRGTSSRFKGVSYCKRRRKWRADLYWNGKYLSLGYFDEEVQAARAYDHKAVECFGEFANLNFPEEWPPGKIREVHAKRRTRKSGKGSTERVLRTRRRTEDSPDHGQDARAHEAAQSPRAKPNGNGSTPPTLLW